MGVGVGVVSGSLFICFVYSLICLCSYEFVCFTFLGEGYGVSFFGRK